MNGIQSLQSTLNSTLFLFNMYVDDLSDADLLVRPVPAANHLAWQIGHIIAGEVMIIKGQLPDAVYPELPAGFVETHSQPNASKDGPEGFCTKAEYVQRLNEVRQATLTTLSKLNDADLDRPSEGRMAKFAPHLGDMFILVSNHTLMHAGQFSVLRRKLGKPVLF